jgi:hypothetical protein
VENRPSGRPLRRHHPSPPVALRIQRPTVTYERTPVKSSGGRLRGYEERAREIIDHKPASHICANRRSALTRQRSGDDVPLLFGDALIEQ